MIVIDNIIFKLQKAGGISVVWKNLIQNLLTYGDDIKFIDFSNCNNMFRSSLSIPKKSMVIQKYFNPILSQLHHPIINFSKPFIFHSSYFRTCNNPNAINITTVHDFIYEQENPSYKQKLRIKLNYKSIRKSDAIVCISNNTKRDLFKFLPDIDPQRVHVIYNGVSEDYRPLAIKPFQEYENHILFVGARDGYKNFEFVVKTLANTSFELLICGKALTQNELTLLNKYLPNHYVNIEFPSNEDLNKIYNSVYALVYPSSYEGFGIPVLEAQRACCPVIALNCSSIPEVIGETPLLMNELSEKELIKKLDYLRDMHLREKIIENGIVNSNRFSWKKMANEYFNLYNKLLSNKIATY